MVAAGKEKFMAGNYMDTALNCERIAGEISRILIDVFVKTLNSSICVIPAKAGI